MEPISVNDVIADVLQKMDGLRCMKKTGGAHEEVPIPDEFRKG
jgi:hypothetical protein